MPRLLSLNGSIDNAYDNLIVRNSTIDSEKHDLIAYGEKPPKVKTKSTKHLKEEQVTQPNDLAPDKKLCKSPSEDLIAHDRENIKHKQQT